ncbi:MAG: 5'-3' exonuclease H3TH domain-containing protein [Rickettsiales bacterium]
MSQKLILIDAYGFIFRAYYVFPKLYNSQNVSLGAIYGFASMLIRLILEMQSNKIIVVFDSGGKNFRHEIYTEYKANRIDIDIDLKNQLAIAKTIPDALGIPYISINGFEADDIIASFTKKYIDHQIIIVSSDKDLMQLINENIIMYDPLKKQYITKKEVFEKFQVEPNKLRDYLAIVGDKSDNIPGIKGAGPKAAINLLNEFSTLENALINIKNIQPLSLQNKVKSDIENAKLSQKLISLCCEAPIEDFNNIYINLDIEKAVKYFKELEFNSLLSKISQLENKYKTIHNSLDNNIVIDKSLININNINENSTNISTYTSIDTKNINTSIHTNINSENTNENTTNNLNKANILNNQVDINTKTKKIIKLEQLTQNQIDEIIKYFIYIGVCIVDIKDDNNIILASKDTIYHLKASLLIIMIIP